MLSQLEYGIAKENRPNRQADRFAGSVLPLAASLTHKPNIMKPIPTDTFQPAILPQAFETEIKSTCTGRIYRIQTATLGEMPSEGYPVLFVLDGEAFFPSLFNIMQSLMPNPVTRSNAPCLIVGIGYTTGSVRDLTQRAADYTPPLGDNATADERQQFGQADRFAAFIDSELTAFLESKYRLDKNETAVFGHSFGALFGLYSLLSHRRFRRHWLVSPSIWWHNRRILGFMPSENRLDGIEVCLNIGALERGSDCKRREGRDMAGQAEQMAAELDRRGAAVFFREYPNADHGNVSFYSLTDCVEYLRKAWQR
ncbi:alpha/beta hydrolase [Neisseria meningitidis]|uniref:alpha/beta hydrolase n=1 Tax=Neisseria meningitidis TaxID=487 RepID=UPI001C56FE3B|nr:alpha/beta hydrolase [Neisseria meningitidis]MBW3877507.1 alpha/beta hydrolase [Neisseria meningitidis]MBW3883560.1 alpha/beta hydrolase [Neisseria meningitidis]MBW3907639.1 alpha/beta hydrolase [Neisseria meningitidis]MBW3925557.1 alpha/beta hydrolase [Neisseria meningitidis]MBW3936142.1 alpha/beta hydrolase [Neisseria meningitidis]